MTEIYDGKVIHRDALTVNAKGGTELMAERMARDIPQEVLTKVQIIHSRPRFIADDRPVVLVAHDLADDPEMSLLSDPDTLSKIDMIVFVSYWQAEAFRVKFNLRRDQYCVIPNGIERFGKVEKPTDRVNLIYHTTPHRGLEIVIPSFLELVKIHPNIHLDVFSSFDIYGWSERNGPYERVFDICRNHPQITYHGTQSNEVVREYLAKAHIFAFPSIWPETSCLALIEAMCAGVITVHSDLAALPETSMNQTVMYHSVEDHEMHMNLYHAVLSNVIEYVTRSPNAPHEITKYVAERFYDWNRISQIWTSVLKGITANYVASRKAVTKSNSGT